MIMWSSRKKVFSSPKPDALPDCATPRTVHLYRYIDLFQFENENEK